MHSGPHLLSFCKFCLKNAQQYVANLLNICAELFFPEKSESFARFFSHKCSMQVNVKEFLRNLNVFYSTSLLYT